MGPATSSGLATRPRGMPASTRPRAAPPYAGAAMSVSTPPAAPRLTALPRGASPPQHPFTRESMAPSVAA